MRNINVIGNLGQDVTLKTSANGTTFANASVAINDGEKTAWLSCVAFGKTAETMAAHCGKGSKVGITGTLYPNTWVDKSGVTRSEIGVRITELTLISPSKQGTAQQTNAPGTVQPQTIAPAQQVAQPQVVTQPTVLTQPVAPGVTQQVAPAQQAAQTAVPPFAPNDGFNRV